MLRTQFSYYHSHKYGPLGYLNDKNFNRRHNHERFNNHIERAIENNKNQLFVKHHRNKYNGQFPLWVIIDLFSTGDLSYFF